ncbi:MAG: DUF4325 domain-containing protein [Acholeplasmataceae bacterium]|nr:DUF4325 domain-containing protein [Acholeplasmataceae bacterium]
MRTNIALPVNDCLAEDIVWKEKVAPLLRDVPLNIYDVCEYGVTEMINNVIDHSECDKISVQVTIDDDYIEFKIKDYGIGVFNKVQKKLGLEYPHEAIFEIVKGKCTTDPTRHTGEGIFFTSHMFDQFFILSGGIRFVAGTIFEEKSYTFENRDRIGGTVVVMRISKESKVEKKDVFDKFTASNDDDFGFSKTCFPINLAAQEGGKVISRSQAKRILVRADKFSEVILDFKGIEEIGQGFADEVFRVFKLTHPNTRIIPMNTTEDIDKMIKRALTANV